MGWLDWLTSGISNIAHTVESGISYVEHAVGSGVSYVKHLIFPNSNTHITKNVYTKYTEVPKKKVTIPNLGLTPTAKKSLEEVKKGEIPSYIPKPEFDSSPIATKEGVYTPYGYFKTTEDQTKYEIWKFPELYFPDIFKSDSELRRLIQSKEYDKARELFRKKYGYLIKKVVENPQYIKGIEYGTIKYFKVYGNTIKPVGLYESELQYMPPSLRKKTEEEIYKSPLRKYLTKQDLSQIKKEIQKYSPQTKKEIKPTEIKKIKEWITPTSFKVFGTPNSHINIKPQQVKSTEYTHTEVTSSSVTQPLSSIIYTVVPIMSVVAVALIMRKIVKEVRV